MESPQRHGPELSSMAATVEDLRRRVTAIAEQIADTDADRMTGGTQPALRSGTQPALRSGTQPALRSGTQPGVLRISTELFEVERALQEAGRRLARLTDALRRTDP